MTKFRSCIYEGTVVHKRLAPKLHGFSYRVFTLCLDVDEIDRLAGGLHFFSRNRPNLISIEDFSLGTPGAGRVGDKVRATLSEFGLARFSESIDLVCYPRIFGYVFNPLTVYFCRDSSGAIGVMIYEVSNTMGERRSYVIPVCSSGAAMSHSCQKELYVSPFTAPGGVYGFHGLPPGERLIVGVNFRENGLPVLKTHFHGERRALTDAMILRLSIRYPFMTMKVIGAIHVEAAKLWRKGVPVQRRDVGEPYSCTLVGSAGEASHHA